MIFAVRIPSRLAAFEPRFQDAIDSTAMRAVEHGFVVHYKRGLRNAMVQEFTNIDDSAADERSFMQTSISDLYFGFGCIGIGLSISCIIFAGEFLFNSKICARKCVRC